MSNHPILFSGPMVRALLDGSKTQTRRVVTHEHAREVDLWAPDDRNPAWWRLGVHSGSGQVADMGAIRCPYGAAGDRLWVRETWAPVDDLADGIKREDPTCVGYRADQSARSFETSDPPDGRPLDTFAWNWDLVHWRPSIFMPRWASRITLEITELRAQRVQEISEADAIAEGATPCTHPKMHGATYIRYYACLWDSVNGKRPGCAWADNPWVWAVTFRRVEDAAAPQAGGQKP